MVNILKLYKETTEDGIITKASFPGEGDNWACIADYKYSATRMGNPPTISATLEWPTCLDDEWNSEVFVEFRGEKYFINGVPSSSRSNSKTGYTHNVEFISERSVLSRVYFLDVIQVQNPSGAPENSLISDRSDFSFSGNLEDLASRLNISLNNSGIGSGSGGYSVVVDSDIELEDKLFTVSNQTIIDVLNSANETFNIPYYFVGKTIHFGYYQDELKTAMEYGAKGSLLSINKNSSNNDIITKITGFGSDRNIPYYYPNPTPKGFVSLSYNSDYWDNERYSPRIENFYKFWNFLEFGERLSYDTTLSKNYVPLIYRKYNSSFDEWYSPDGIEASAGKWTFELQVEKVEDTIFELGITVYDVLNGDRVYDDYTISEAKFWSDQLDGQGAYFTIVSNRKIAYNADLSNNDVAYDVSLTLNFSNTGKYRVVINKTIAPAWVSNIKDGTYQPSDFGLAFDFEPWFDDTISMILDYRINTQSKLMPSVYRASNGSDRWIYASGAEYENKYSPTHPMEYIHTEDEIYPTITNVKNDSGQRIDIFSEIAFDETDNNEVYPEGHKYAGKYKHPYFFAKLRKLDGEDGFNLFQHAIEGQPMTISFTSGHTASCEFKIAVDESSMKNTVQVDANGNLKRDSAGDVLCNRGEQPRLGFVERQQDTSKYEVWIALEKEDSTMGVMMPDLMSNIVPTNSDTFVILGIHLPEAYFTAAEKKLDEALIKHMLENNFHKFTYSADLSSIFLKENPEVYETLNENSRVPLLYNGKLISWLLVESYNYSIKQGHYLPDISITLNDNIKVATSKSTATSKAISSANATASKSQSMATSAINRASSTAAKTQSIERRVESLEQNSSNISVDKLKAQVSTNSSDIYELDKRVTDIENSGGGGITDVKVNGSSVVTKGVASIPTATTSRYGATKLTSSTSSPSTTMAATASAVKAAYDLANSYKGTVTKIKLNNKEYSPSAGVVDLGTISGGSGSSTQIVSKNEDYISVTTNTKGEFVIGAKILRLDDVETTPEDGLASTRDVDNKLSQASRYIITSFSAEDLARAADERIQVNDDDRYDSDLGEAISQNRPIYIRASSSGQGGLIPVNALKDDFIYFDVLYNRIIFYVTIEGGTAYFTRRKLCSIDNILAVKPTIKIFYPTGGSNVLDRAKIQITHPYEYEASDCEFVLMRHRKSKKSEPNQKVSGGWSVCIGAKEQGTSTKMATNETPYTFGSGWLKYKDFLEQTCARAMLFNYLIPGRNRLHMSQAMTLKNSSALSLLKTYYYGVSSDESSLFGRGHNKVRLGVALRVKNPEFYDYFDSEPDDSAQWKISAAGRPIPRYFYSSVTEIVLSAGSVVSGHPKIQIRD